MKIYVVIVSYNGMQWTDRCLGSLRSSLCAVNTVIIDNGSTDGSPEKIASEYPEMMLIRSEENLGFGKANNVGIRKALDEGATHIFLLNQDAWVEPGTIGGLLELSVANPAFGIISPVHLNGSYTALDYNFSNYLSPSECPGFYSDLYLGKQKLLYEASFVNAAAWFIPASCLLKVGLFEPLFFLYREDNNLAQRVQYHKLKLGVTPHITICHDREVRKGQFTPVGAARAERAVTLMVMLNVGENLFKCLVRLLRLRLVIFLTSLAKGDLHKLGLVFKEGFFVLFNLGRLDRVRKNYNSAAYLKAT